MSQTTTSPRPPQTDLSPLYGELVVSSRTTTAPKGREWLPGGRKVSFLSQRVLSQSALCDESRDGIPAFSATFFRDMPAFRRTVTATFDRDPEARKAHEAWRLGQTRPVMVALQPYQHGEPRPVLDTESLALISQGLRDSSTLGQSDAIEASNAVLFTDRGGLGYLARGKALPAQFERLLICQMLVMAYADVFESTAERLAELTCTAERGADSDQLLALYESFLTFSAAHYTSLPVQRHSSELYEQHDLLARHYRLAELQQEVERQMHSLGQFLQAEQSRRTLEQQTIIMQSELTRAAAEAEERRKAEAERATSERHRAGSERREKFLNAAVSVLGLLIAGLSLPDPLRESIGSTLQAWLSALLS